MGERSSPTGRMPGLTIRAMVPVLALTTVLCAESGTGPEPVSPTGRIAGVVVEVGSEAPVAGATVEMQPGARVTETDSEGRFAFDGLVVPGDYLLTITSPDHVTVSVPVTLSEAEPEPEIRLPLPPRPVPDPDPAPDDDSEAIRALGWVVQGAFGPGETMTWEVVLAAPEGNERAIVLRDTLDPAFGAVVDAGSIELDRNRFPDAEIEIHDDRRSFTVRLGPVSTDGELERVLLLTVPSPPVVGTVCNTVLLFVDGSPTDHHVSCITETV